MKKIFLFGSFILVILAFETKQICPISKVYAYSQVVSPGVSPKGPVEEGGMETKSDPGSARSNFFIYMLSKKKYSFSPTVLWIKGQGFEVKTDTITKLPVKLSHDGKYIQLVPSTTKRVVMLTPGPVMNFFAPPPAELQKLLDTNEMVIEYRWNDETCYFSVPKIKILERVAAE